MIANCSPGGDIALHFISFDLPFYFEYLLRSFSKLTFQIVSEMFDLAPAFQIGMFSEFFDCIKTFAQAVPE